MADGAMIAFAATKFVRDQFRAFNIFKDFGGDFGTCNERCADFDTGIIGGEQDLLKRRLFTGLNAEQLDIHDIAWLDAELSSAGLNNCVSHNFSSKGQET